MNCTRYRYLIQKNFDTDLTKQDENSLLKHLDTCDSCGKFNHQIQQVIASTNDLNLPKSILPTSPEVICKKIIEELPKPKNSIVDLISSFITNLTKPKSKAPNSAKPVSKNSKQASNEKPVLANKSKDGKVKTVEEEEHLAQTSRLRSIGKAVSDVVESRESQSTTKSLGQKLKIVTPNSLTQEERPLTAAELIKLKVAENQKSIQDAEPKPEPVKSGTTSISSQPTNPIDLSTPLESNSSKTGQNEDQMIVQPILGDWQPQSASPKPDLWGADSEEADWGQSIKSTQGKNASSTNPIQNNQQNSLASPIASNADSDQAHDLDGWQAKSSEWLSAPSELDTSKTSSASTPPNTNNIWGNTANNTSNPNVNTDAQWGVTSPIKPANSQPSASRSQSLAGWGSSASPNNSQDSDLEADWGLKTPPVNNPVASHNLVTEDNDTISKNSWGNPQAASVSKTSASQSVAAWGQPSKQSAWGSETSPETKSNAGETNLNQPKVISVQPSNNSQDTQWNGVAQSASAWDLAVDNTNSDQSNWGQAAVGGQGLSPQAVSGSNIANVDNSPISAWGAPVSNAQSVSPQAISGPNIASVDNSPVSAWGAPVPNAQSVSPQAISGPNIANIDNSQISAWGAPVPNAQSLSPQAISGQNIANVNNSPVSGWGMPNISSQNIPSNTSGQNIANANDTTVAGWGVPAAAAQVGNPIISSHNQVTDRESPQTPQPTNNNLWDSSGIVQNTNANRENGFNSTNVNSLTSQQESVKKPVLNRRNLVLPEEQISTGNWKAFTPNQNSLTPGNKGSQVTSQSSPVFKGDNPFESESLTPPGFNNQTPSNQPIQANNPPNQPGFNNQTPFNQPIQANNLTNQPGFNNQTPFNQPIQANNLTNQPGFNNQTPFNQPIQTSNLTSQAGFNNQTPFNQPVQSDNLPSQANNLPNQAAPVNNPNRFEEPIQAQKQAAPVNNPNRFEEPIQAQKQAAPVNNPNRFEEPIQAQKQASVNNPNRFEEPIQAQKQAAPVNNPNRFEEPIQAQKQAAPVNNPNRFEEPVSSNPGGLLGPISDNDMDKIFSENLGLKDVSTFNSSPVQNVKQPDSPPSPISTTANPSSSSSNRQEPDSGGLFNLNDDDIDNIFSINLGVSTDQKPVNERFNANNVDQEIANTPESFNQPVKFNQFSPQSGNDLNFNPNSQIGQNNQPTLNNEQPPNNQPFNQPQLNNEQPSSGLFNLNDNDMDKLFAENLGIKDNTLSSSNGVNNNVGVMGTDYSQATGQVQSQAVPAGIPNTPSPLPVNQNNVESANNTRNYVEPNTVSNNPNASQTNLFSFNQNMINNLYNNDNASSQTNVNASSDLSQPANYQKQPLQLNPINYPSPKITGIGRLDTKHDVGSDSVSGRISNIGNFLLDQKDKEGLKNLMNKDNKELNTRILTEETFNNLRGMLERIQTQAQVVGSVLVGMDGFLYSNTMPNDIDAESFGVWALGLFMNTSNVIKQLQFNKVKHIISKTKLGYLIIADCKDVILVTVSNGNDTQALMPLMKTITSLLPK